MDPTVDQMKSPPAEEKIDKLKIVLDNDENTYYSGQTIHGTIFLPTAQKTKIRGIYFRVIGKAKCGWSEWLVRESKPVDGKTETTDARYWGKEDHLNPAVYVAGTKNGCTFSAEKSYNFSFDLKKDLPSSFSTQYGKIKYKMEFVVDKPWFNDSQEVTLNIIRSVNLDQCPNTDKPFENQVTKTYGLIDSGPISLHVSLTKQGFILGEQMPVKVAVTNCSKLHIEKVKCYLNQVVQYHSQAPSQRIRTEHIRVLKKETDAISKKSEEKFDIIIDLPMNIAPTQDSTVSRLIHINYELQIETKMPTFQKNISITIPITIGTVSHLRNVSSQPGFRVSLGATTSPEQRLSTMFSNIDIGTPERSSMVLPYPTVPSPFMPNIPSNQSIGTPERSSIVLPYPTVPPTFMPNVTPNQSFGYSPSAPPIDFIPNITPDMRNSVYIPRPPSYFEVFGNQDISQIDSSNSTSFHNSSTKS